ncbi:MAG TPA: carboxypeptidase-like regulatory domain-containing protein [Panacibacter sp.]|nr:carboxypeptidase-like regulatory domain-containing protein [Panacibacter sp.]
MKFLFVLISAMLIMGCSSSSVPPVSSGKQKIIGAVNLYDDLNNSQSPDGMTVNINGTAFTAITDSSGRYTIANVPLGTYTLSYSKRGYGTYQLDTLYHHQNINDTPTIIPRMPLGKISATAVTNIEVTITGDTIKINPAVNPAGDNADPRGVRLFYATTDAVAGDNYNAYSEVYRIRNSTGVIKKGKSEFYNMGFAPGATIFVKAYGEAFTANDYIDIATGKRIFPNLNTTTVAAKSFVLP